MLIKVPRVSDALIAIAASDYTTFAYRGYSIRETRKSVRNARLIGLVKIRSVRRLPEVTQTAQGGQTARGSQTQTLADTPPPWKTETRMTDDVAMLHEVPIVALL